MEIKDTTEKKRLQEYIATIQNIAENTSALGSEQESFLESVRGLKQSLESGVYRVAVVGEFSTGKSTFINALMGEKILYASNKEATGAVTAIRRGDKAYVNIYTKDNSMIEKFSLDNEEGKEKLNEYLDINSGKNAGYVEINYPITEIDENIYFVDTPGIEKMSPQQMELTRDALKNANAIIFLIKKEGFTEPALKIITGKHEVIGKIPSKDIFVVMTHMSDIYQQMEKDVSKKISELKRKVEKILAENQLEDVKVYPVDSIDYLLGRNTELYEQEKADHDISLKGQMLSQDEYLKRSGFGVFLAELFDFLQEDTRQKNLLTDIKDKFSILINSLLEELQKEQDGLIKEFHIDEKIVFKKPDIEEMSNSGLCAELSKVELALKENLRELKEQEENSTEEARKALQVQIREKEIQKEAVRNQLFELGGYRARYKDVENEGGEHAGKKIGRAAGEVADIALLLWNPAGAAGTAGKVLKTADTAKDALTAGKLIEKSLIVLKKGQSVVDKVKDKVEENCDETEQTELPTLLDCLSLGFWAEKVGGMIGEKIKPTTHSKIEDEEWKQQYLDQQNMIKEEIASITSDIRNREAELSEMDDYGKERRIRKELDVQRRLLQDKKDNLEKMIAQENEANKKKKEKNYYSDTIDSYLNREKQNANEMIQSAYNEFKMRLVEDMRCRCQQKIEEIEDLLDEVSCDREQKSSQIDMLDADIEQLKSGKEDIEKWLSV